MSRLPTGWEERPLSDLVDIVRGITFTKSQRQNEAGEGLIECLRTSNVQLSLTTDRMAYVPSTCVRRADQLVNAGDVIISMSNSSELVGKVALATEVHSGFAFGAFLAALRAAAFEPKALWYLMKSSRVQSELRGTSSQTTNIANISISGMAQLRLPVPPLAEQRRIVAKLDALNARTARARADLDRISVLAARYKQAVLAAVYEGGLSVEPARSLPIREVVASMDQGWSPRCDREAADTSDWGVIKTTAIQAISFDETANKRLPKQLAPRPSIVISPGDVLITRAGPRNRVGITCVVREVRHQLMLCDKAYRLRTKPEILDPEYLTLMLNSPAALASIETMKTGISDSGLNLTQGKLLSLAVPVPPLAEQERLVFKVTKAFAEINRLTAEATAARRLLDRLDQAVLSNAFRGELVPQDPADEPASVLLDRISAERPSAPKAARGRRRAVA